MTPDRDLRTLIVCPRDRLNLKWGGDASCANGHRYPVVHGIPVLFGDRDPTGFSSRTIDRVEHGGYEVEIAAPSSGRVDEVVQDAIVGTNGNMYRHLAGRLPRYPIPQIRLPRGDGRLLLDVGGGWGRWSLAAARAGYRPVLIDPQLDLVLAAARVSRQLDLDVMAVCGDATALPFVDNAFDVVFSYSVLQHFAKPAARAALAEIQRVARRGGTVLVQLANRWGSRQLMMQVVGALGGGTRGRFRVRYWTSSEMRTTFDRIVGPGDVEVDGFFSLNVQPTDLDLLPPRYRALVRISERLRRRSRDVPTLRYVADSLYVRAVVRDSPSNRTTG